MRLAVAGAMPPYFSSEARRVAGVAAVFAAHGAINHRRSPAHGSPLATGGRQADPHWPLVDAGRPAPVPPRQVPVAPARIPSSLMRLNLSLRRRQCWPLG